MTFIVPTLLTGKHVSLEPLASSHETSLAQAIRDGELWNLWFTTIPRPEGVADYVRQLMEQQQQGVASAFAVRDHASGAVVGCSRYLHIEPANRRLEIGGTWYAQRVQRSAVNTECKLLMLAHAFETLDCIAVEFRTDWFNKRSQAAIERLGAKQDGILRNHMIMADGRVRDTVVYSIIRNEWNGVKMNLLHKLQRAGGNE